jgi:hypothetical protein
MGAGRRECFDGAPLRLRDDDFLLDEDFSTAERDVGDLCERGAAAGRGGGLPGVLPPGVGASFSRDGPPQRSRPPGTRPDTPHRLVHRSHRPAAGVVRTRHHAHTHGTGGASPIRWTGASSTSTPGMGGWPPGGTSSPGTSGVLGDVHPLHAERSRLVPRRERRRARHGERSRPVVAVGKDQRKVPARASSGPEALRSPPQPATLRAEGSTYRRRAPGRQPSRRPVAGAAPARWNVGADHPAASAPAGPVDTLVDPHRAVDELAQGDMSGERFVPTDDRWRVYRPPAR